MLPTFLVFLSHPFGCGSARLASGTIVRILCMGLLTMLFPRMTLAQVPSATQGVHEPGSFRENYLPNRLINSDGLLVGLEAGELADLPANEMTVYLPSTDQDSLCVSIRSIDGKYTGIFGFATRRMQGRAVRINIRSRNYASEVAAYSSDQLATSAFLGNLCSQGGTTLVVVGRSRVSVPRSLRLSLNADAGLLVQANVDLASPPQPLVRCPLIDSHEAHTYNRVCAIPLTSTGRPYDLQVTLRRPGQNPRVVTYRVLVP